MFSIALDEQRAPAEHRKQRDMAPKPIEVDDAEDPSVPTFKTVSRFGFVVQIERPKS